ncbi:MAG: DUF5020 family protein [Candidatus Marinimicrobia bacterium]|nr:DUF5020 family protein [Candidatus Neomarinimicrobiota bacterium]
MRISAIPLMALLLNLPVNGQNLQLHYDLGEDRDYFTSTLEMFRPDSAGATFFFVDFDYNSSSAGSASLAYWEFARYFRVPALPGLSWTIQFNDGVAPWGPIGDVWLAGVSFPLNLGVITVATDLLYRRARFSDGKDLQLTMVWFQPLLAGKLTLTGYIDLRSDRPAGSKREIVVLAEPQLWYQVRPDLALGGELEISHNFLPETGWPVKPTVAVKWQF